MSAQDSETVGIPARLETGVASLSGKTALVTGGSRGIGRGISRALAGVGVNVGIGYLERSDEAAELVREVMLLGGRAITVSADLRSTEAVEYLVDQVTKEFGAIDILVSSAGHMIPAKLADIDDSLWQATIDEQLRAALLLTRAVVPAMQSQKFGRIVYISSISAFTGGALGAHYAIAKAGLLGLMH